VTRVSLRQSDKWAPRIPGRPVRDKANKGPWCGARTTHVSELHHPQFAELRDGCVGGLGLQKELAQDHLLAAEETAHGETSEDGASCWPGERLRRTDFDSRAHLIGGRTVGLGWSASLHSLAHTHAPPRTYLSPRRALIAANSLSASI
jgi:hypothetical protein